ncbi:transposase [Rhizobium leguminosarum]|uniref:transposase n=1 Tax=Rhizobium leguminosarum TaxID=384 RepID=UPI001C91E3CC|nr:transposase [Rhizobium leguminosarum]MBY2938088.1 transposase [Rhizobium leguminosarum]
MSNDTLLRILRRHTRAPTEPLNVVGIDDWAWRRNYRYGSIVCDLERRCIVALLPDREMATVEAWLADHPSITVVSRDRGGGDGEATARALPNTMQVADRWHLMENASGAFLDAVRCVPACKIGSDAFLMTISFTLPRSIVPEEDPAWHAHTFAF